MNSDKKNEFNTDATLAELLEGVTEPSEAQAIRKAWQATGRLAAEQITPAPGRELQGIFRNEEEAMSDDDLNMLAAAGSAAGMSGVNGDSGFVGTEGADSGRGTRGDDVMLGLGGNDTLSGGPGDDMLMGGPGNDVLSGDEGNDLLLGSSGDDILSGGSGNDTLCGGDGSDELSGGPGEDIFVFRPDEEGVNMVTDFCTGNDTLILEGATSMDDFSVQERSGETVIEFGSTTIILEGATLTAEDVWKMQR